MKTVPITEHIVAQVTQMRPEGSPDQTVDQLLDGNMIPRLCAFAGAGACAQVCQRKAMGRLEAGPKVCAEDNIVEALAKSAISPENFAMIAATEDRVGFGDQMAQLGAAEHPDGYATVPACNAFFFRPGKDGTPKGDKLTHVAMRMADCGDVVYQFKDNQGDQVVGIAHFSRTNMRGPSAYIHQIDGKRVSWGEYVLSSAVAHYGADPASVQVRLVAAVEGKDFIHHYKTLADMNGHYPGWTELGFMHPRGTEDFDCLIKYRQMIEWQLQEGVQNPSLRLRPEQIEVGGAINTGDLAQGHASHHAASKGAIPHGRDMYMVGLSK